MVIELPSRTTKKILLVYNNDITKKTCLIPDAPA